MLATFTSAVAVRVLFAIVAFAVLSVFSEFIVVLALKTLNPDIRFTGIGAIVLFTAFCAMLPSWPAPSKICGMPLSRRQRILILIEATVAVAIAISAFVLVTEQSHHSVALGCVLSYLILVTLMALWRRWP